MRIRRSVFVGISVACGNLNHASAFITFIVILAASPPPCTPLDHHPHHPKSSKVEKPLTNNQQNDGHTPRHLQKVATARIRDQSSRLSGGFDRSPVEGGEECRWDHDREDAVGRGRVSLMYEQFGSETQYAGWWKHMCVHACSTTVLQTVGDRGNSAQSIDRHIQHSTSNIDLGKEEEKKHDTHPIVNRDWFICTLCACRFCSKMRAPPVRKAIPGMRSRCRMTTPAMVAWRRRSLPMCVSYGTGRQVKSKVLLELATYSHLIKRTMARVPSTALKYVSERVRSG
jgi:hypothetical protein